jgi:hypothetical protein
MVKEQRKKGGLEAVMKKKPKICSVLCITAITVSFIRKITAKHSQNCLSTRNAGVPYSQEKDTKEAITGKIKEKKNHGKAYFTMPSQKCEQNVMQEVHFV